MTNNDHTQPADYPVRYWLPDLDGTHNGTNDRPNPTQIVGARDGVTR